MTAFFVPGFMSHARVGPYLAAADITVAPEPKNSYTDRSTMIKLMEYMALRKPIVAFDLTEHRVTAQEAALYAHPNDTLDFARQIAVLIDDPPRRERMGEFGRERVVSQLAWRHQAEHLLEAYRKLELGSEGLVPQTVGTRLVESRTSTS